MRCLPSALAPQLPFHMFALASLTTGREINARTRSKDTHEKPIGLGQTAPQRERKSLQPAGPWAPWAHGGRAGARGHWDGLLPWGSGPCPARLPAAALSPNALQRGRSKGESESLLFMICVTGGSRPDRRASHHLSITSCDCPQQPAADRWRHRSAPTGHPQSSRAGGTDVARTGLWLQVRGQAGLWAPWRRSDPGGCWCHG